MLNKSVECDSCQKEMNVDDIKVHEESFGVDLSKRYWNCIHCDYEYLITINDTETRAIEEVINNDNREIQSIAKSAQWLANRRRLSQKQMNRNLKRARSLKNKIEQNKVKLDKLQRKLINEYI